MVGCQGGRQNIRILVNLVLNLERIGLFSEEIYDYKCPFQEGRLR